MPDITPRYLVPFHPKDVAHRFTDVLIIGGGLAGLRGCQRCQFIQQSDDCH